LTDEDGVMDAPDSNSDEGYGLFDCEDLWNDDRQHCCAMSWPSARRVRERLRIGTPLWKKKR
jgi:hypothetical protein